MSLLPSAEETDRHPFKEALADEIARALERSAVREMFAAPEGKALSERSETDSPLKPL